MSFDFNLKELQEEILKKVMNDYDQLYPAPSEKVREMQEAIYLVSLNLCRQFIEANNQLLWEELKKQNLVS